jgi:hypothetical protein
MDSIVSRTGAVVDVLADNPTPGLMSRETMSRRLRATRRLATRWNTVTTAGISTGDKVSTSIRIGRNIGSPAFLPRSGSLHFFSEGRATLRDSRR